MPGTASALPIAAAISYWLPLKFVSRSSQGFQGAKFGISLEPAQREQCAHLNKLWADVSEQRQPSSPHLWQAWLSNLLQPPREP